MNTLLDSLKSEISLFVRQRKELAELIGFESRNKYAIETEGGRQIGFAAEQHKGIFGFLARQFLGHWRSFDIHVFNEDKSVAYIANHPFRFLFSRITVLDGAGRLQGAVQRRFGILHKKLDIEDAQGRVVLKVSSPLWRIWTFEFRQEGQTLATVQKKWSGLIKEAFTDSDNFRLEWSANLPPEQRALVLVACLLIDLTYFEKKANSN